MVATEVAGIGEVDVEHAIALEILRDGGIVGASKVASRDGCHELRELALLIGGVEGCIDVAYGKAIDELQEEALLELRAEH